MNHPTETDESDVRALSDDLSAANQALEEARESLVLQHLGLSASLARRRAGRRNVEEQFNEAALVGLMRAIDSFDPRAPAAFEPHAEELIKRELDQLEQDWRDEREDRILQREQAAIRAMARIEHALLAQPGFRVLAVSLGFPADDLASGFLSAVLRHPEILSRTAAAAAAAAAAPAK